MLSARWNKAELHLLHSPHPGRALLVAVAATSANTDTPGMFQLEAFPSDLVARRFRPRHGLVTLTTLRSYTELTNAVATLCGYDRKTLDEGAGESGRADHGWAGYASANKKCLLIRWQVGGGAALLAFGTHAEAGKSRQARFWLAGLADEIAWPALSALNVHLHGWSGPANLAKALKTYGDGTIPQRGLLNEQFASMWVATDEAGDLPAASGAEAWSWLGAVSVQAFPAAQPPAELSGRYSGQLHPGDRLIGGRSFAPAEDLLMLGHDECMPKGVADILARTSVRRAQAMFDNLLAPYLAPEGSTDEFLQTLQVPEGSDAKALARERLFQLQMTTIRPPLVRGTEAVFSSAFRQKPSHLLIGTHDQTDTAPFSSEHGRDLIVAVVRETLEHVRRETDPKPKSFLDNLGWGAGNPDLGFQTRPARPPYYLPLHGLPCRVDRQAIVWRPGEDLALAVDFGVRGRSVLFGRLTVQARRGRA